MFFRPISQYWYICLKRTVINSDLTIYQSDDYKELVEKDLRTGVEKYIFNQRDDAERKLEKLGTNWNLCTVEMPNNVVEKNLNTQAYQFNPRVIKSAEIRIIEIFLHPLLRSKPETQVTKL